MRSLIVGTAGHIDHGKSALVRALTGTDPDRLKEERERGITIDLGFAHRVLADGTTLSFVDVPGHERFVRNMLAGAHGLDAVLLVVAADESVMPQTREHFHICRLLGIPTGVIALTKCDLADDDLVTLAEQEVRELVRGSFLEGAPIVRVSAVRGDGLERLVAELAALAATTPERPAEGLLRLPVDRVFTLRGFGTVVTGTLVAGALAIGDEVELLPTGKRSRVRGLQIHGQTVERATAGHRTAVNLASLEVEEIARGHVLAAPDTLIPTALADVEVTLLAGEKALEDRTRVRVHAGSAEVLGRLEPIGGTRITPDTPTPVQLRLEAPTVLGRGDRLVLRSYSPASTIGGARVLDPLAPRRRRRDPAAATRLAALAAADPLAAARLFVEEAGPQGIDLRRLAARLTIRRGELEKALASESEVTLLGREPGWAVSRAALDGRAAAVLDTLARYHREQRLRETMPLEELRARVFAHSPAGAAERVLERLAGDGRVRLTADGVALASHRPTLTANEERVRAALLQAASAAGLAGLSAEDLTRAASGDVRLGEQVARTLVTSGALVRVGAVAWLERQQVEALVQKVRERWAPGTTLDVGAFKELTGLTRKHAIPLLELLDTLRVTRRSGNERIVIG